MTCYVSSTEFLYKTSIVNESSIIRDVQSVASRRQGPLNCRLFENFIIGGKLFCKNTENWAENSHILGKCLGEN